jgi:hypothetical protein
VIDACKGAEEFPKIEILFNEIMIYDNVGRSSGATHHFASNGVV